jgi:hypothetical protein
MSTPITTYGLDAVPEATGKRSGWLLRAFERFIAAREAQGRRRALEYLSSLSDERLAQLGYTDTHIRQIREERSLPYPSV